MYRSKNFDESGLKLPSPPRPNDFAGRIHSLNIKFDIPDMQGRDFIVVHNEIIAQNRIELRRSIGFSSSMKRFWRI